MQSIQCKQARPLWLQQFWRRGCLRSFLSVPALGEDEKACCDRLLPLYQYKGNQVFSYNQNLMQYQETTSNQDMFEDPHGQTSNWFTIPGASEPFCLFFDQAISLGPTDVTVSQLSDEHKQNSTPNQPIAPTDSNNQQDGATFPTAKKPEAKDPTVPISFQASESTEAGNKKSTKKASKRADDNNNIHKKFITVQNEVLKKFKMLTKIKNGLKKAGMSFQKGSRYSFVTRLIDAQQLFDEELFHAFLASYRARIASVFKLPDNPNDADKLLYRLIQSYSQSCELFAEGKEIEAVDVIYDIPKAKEDKYKERGIQKVREYRKKRFP